MSTFSSLERLFNSHPDDILSLKTHCINYLSDTLAAVSSTSRILTLSSSIAQEEKKIDLDDDVQLDFADTISRRTRHQKNFGSSRLIVESTMYSNKNAVMKIMAGDVIRYYSAVGSARSFQITVVRAISESGEVHLTNQHILAADSILDIIGKIEVGNGNATYETVKRMNVFS